MIESDELQPDWQVVFFAHLATLLAARATVLILLQQCTRVSPRPRLVARLTNGFAIDLRFVFRGGGLALGTDQGLGLPKAVKRLIGVSKGWLPAPAVKTVLIPPAHAAEECLKVLEGHGSLAPVWLAERQPPSLEAKAAGAWLDEERASIVERNDHKASLRWRVR